MAMSSIAGKIALAIALATFATGAAYAGHRNWSNLSPFEEEGRPVEAKDIAGKKICWNNGHWAIFHPDGTVENDRGHHTRWQVTEPGVIKIGDNYRQTEVLPDGRIHEYWFKLTSSRRDRDLWGTICG
jgi:hypothetical protein